MLRDAGGLPRAMADLVEEKRLSLKPKRKYFCCPGLRGKHNSLVGVDGLLESRKLAMPNARGNGRGEQG
jgi:hypothetical protein